ncbi:MAG: hypothetical protein NT123_22670 [Proteobacteria bacterium]|nr:hypothetical protein [Pseudomonadota bacterium]
MVPPNLHTRSVPLSAPKEVTAATEKRLAIGGSIKKWVLEGGYLHNRITGEKFKIGKEVWGDGDGYQFHQSAKFTYVQDWEVDK